MELGATESTIAVDPDPVRAAESAPIGRERWSITVGVSVEKFKPTSSPASFSFRDPWFGGFMLKRERQSAISARFLAPFPVVVQQLLDALLLPSVFEKKRRRSLPPLNGDQKPPRTTSENLSRRSRPGTGKTQTLVGRVEFTSSGVDAGRILSTFRTRPRQSWRTGYFRNGRTRSDLGRNFPRFRS